MLNATLVKRIKITDDLVIYQVKPDAGVPDFLPGQYVAIALPEEVTEEGKAPKLLKRAYSIGSTPKQKDYIEFYIAIVKDGALTPKLYTLNEGDRLYVAPKITGTFTLAGLPEDSNLILVSTGTGIAPYLAMLRSPETWKDGRKIAVLHGVRYVTDLGYADELTAFAEKNPNFKYLPIVSRPDGSWQGNKGYVQSFFKDGTLVLDPAKDHVFLCGNPAMIDEMEVYLGNLGYTEHTRKAPGNMHLEKYW